MLEGGQEAGKDAGRSARQAWRAAVLAPAGDGQRRRRGSDAAALVLALAALVCCLLVIRYNSRVDRAVTAVIHPPPRSISWLVTVVYQLGSAGVGAGLVAAALIARRWAMARDVALSAAVAAGASGIMAVVLGSGGGRQAGVAIGGYVLTFPAPRIALAMAVITAALPYLARGVQRASEILFGLAALAAVVGGHGLPLNVAGSLAVGWAAALAARLALGSPLGLPSPGDVRLLLRELGIEAAGVRPASRQTWGAARYEAAEAGGAGSLTVEVYGRDAADARLLSKAARFVLYRDSGPTFTVTRLQQVERQGYLTLRAGQAGAAVPVLVEAGTSGPAGDALVVCRVPAGAPLTDVGPGRADGTGPDNPAPDDRALDDLYRQLLALRRARIAHGAVSGDTLLADSAAGTLLLTGFGSASSSAPDRRLDRDLAGAMAATALAAGAERAAAAAARCLPPEILAGALRYLHPPALDPALRRALKGQPALLAALRDQAAGAASIEVPALLPVSRVSWTTVAMVAGTLIGGWALIGVLLDVSRSFDTVIGADWLWVIIAFTLAQLVCVASAVESLGSVTGPLPLLRVIAVEFAGTFSALAGGTAAVFATRVRFFQRQGYDAAVALSSSAIMTATSWLTVLVLLAVSLPFAWGSLHPDTVSQLTGNQRLVWIILAVAVAVAVAAGLVLAVPRLRRLAADKARPTVSRVLANFREVASAPGKLALLVGGAVARELLVVMTLSVALRAFGDHLALPVLIVVIRLAAMVGGASPSPGGLGVVEAGMILGLTAAGVSEPDATAAVFIQRLFTSYLPPVWGWLTLMWLRRREYL